MQREIDSSLHSLLIANTSARLAPVDGVAGRGELRGRRFTDGSRSSTSGFLVPASFLADAGRRPADRLRRPARLRLARQDHRPADVRDVRGRRRRRAGLDHPAGRRHDRHLEGLGGLPDAGVLRLPLAARAGGRAALRRGPPQRVSEAFEDLDPSRPADAQVLSLFGATRFVPTSADSHTEAERVGRRLGLITGG